MAGRNTTTDRDFGERRIRVLIDELKRSPVADGPHVKVGILASSGEHKDADGASEGVTTVQVAVWNEFGTATIPERPALRVGARGLMGVMAELGAKLLGKMLDGSITLDRALDVLGLRAQAGLRKSINDWTTPPNAMSTILRKARATGRAKIRKAGANGAGQAAANVAAGYNNPLIDTGQYRNSVQYEKVK